MRHDKTCHVCLSSLLTASPHSLGRDDKSTFLSPSITRCKVLPNARSSFGALESAAIFCADLKYSSAFSLKFFQDFFVFFNAHAHIAQDFA